MSSLTNIVRNDYVVATISLFALAYVGSFAPKLPHSLAVFSDNIVVKFIVFYIIAFAITRKFDVALIAALIVLAVVLGVQVYMPNKLGKVEKRENMSSLTDFQPVLASRQAEVTIDNGNFMENEPLNEKWTEEKVNEPMGHSLDWPGYEAAPENVEVPAQVVADASKPSEVVPMNHTSIDSESVNGEILGFVKTDMNHLATV